MNEPALAEYRALRQTIATRGSLRPVLLVAGLGLWASALVAVLVLLPNPITAAVPLLLLAATFEAVRSLHMGAERIGRYVQVYFEEHAGRPGPPAAAPAWEHTAMALGGKVPGAGGHPLFLPLFLIATLLNLLAVVLPEPVPVELILMGGTHLAFVGWLVYADRGVRSQRARELEEFRRLRASEGGTSVPPSAAPP
jgi:hypothetical protein